MRRVPAILLVIFFAAPLLFTAFMTVGVSTWVLDRGFYLSLLQDDRLYQLPTGTGTWWVGDIQGMQGLESRAALLAAREVVSPAWMKAQALGITGQLFDFLQGRGNGFDLTVDMVPVKTALRGEAGRRFADTLARQLPVGGSAADFATGSKRLPVARPPSISVEKASAIIQAGLPAFITSVPDTAHLSDNQFSRSPWGWGPRFPALGALVLADVILLAMGLGFWIAAGFVGGETRFERLQWLGWPLLVPAAGVLLTGLTVMLAFPPGWLGWAIGQAHLETQGFAPSFVDALVAAARQAILRVGTGFIATGAIAAGAALGLLAWSWSIPAEERSPRQGA